MKPSAVLDTKFDAEVRFRTRASRDSAEHGLKLLETLRQRHREAGKRRS